MKQELDKIPVGAQTTMEGAVLERGMRAVHMSAGCCTNLLLSITVHVSSLRQTVLMNMNC
jgi:hypothetical protein